MKPTEHPSRRRTGYVPADFLEAVEVWRERCAFCGRTGQELKASRHHMPPLPVCAKCQDAAVQCKATPLVRSRVARWLNSVHPGCPMPRPVLVVKA